MKVLYIGDIMAEPGINLTERLLPQLRRQHDISLVIAQAENVTDGKGIAQTDVARLKKAGVNFFTGGNHTLKKPEIFPSLNDPSQPIIRPANYPADTPGLGAKLVSVSQGQVLVVSLLGQIVGRDAAIPLDNPLEVIDTILAQYQSTKRVATIVNFHGDYSSEKVVIGHYLDGKVTAVIGDHWHVPTADARVLPGGTAHITDVGMVGVLNSSLGVETAAIIARWHDHVQNKNVLAHTGPMQFNAVIITVDEETGLAAAINPIHDIIELE